MEVLLDDLKNKMIPVADDVRPGTQQVDLTPDETEQARRYEVTTSRSIEEWSKRPGPGLLGAMRSAYYKITGGGDPLDIETLEMQAKANREWTPMQAEDIDPVVLQFPAYTRRINYARKTMDDESIVKELTSMEQEDAANNSNSAIMEKYGRTPESVNELAKYAEAQQLGYYTELYKDKTADDIRTRLAASRVTGLSPQLLMDDDNFKRFVLDQGYNVDSSVLEQLEHGTLEAVLQKEISQIGYDASTRGGLTPGMDMRRKILQEQLKRISPPINQTMFQKIARMTSSVGVQQLMAAFDMVKSPETYAMIASGAALGAATTAPSLVAPVVGEVVTGTAATAGAVTGVGAAFMRASVEQNFKAQTAEAYFEAIDAGVPHDIAWSRAVASGTITSAMEYFSMTKILPFIPGLGRFAKPEQLVARTVGGNRALATLGQGLVAWNWEGVTEAGQRGATALFAGNAMKAAGVGTYPTMKELGAQMWDDYSSMWYAFPLMLPGVGSGTVQAYQNWNAQNEQIKVYAHLLGMPVEDFRLLVEQEHEKINSAATTVGNEILSEPVDPTEGGRLTEDGLPIAEYDEFEFDVPAAEADADTPDGLVYVPKEIYAQNQTEFDGLTTAEIGDDVVMTQSAYDKLSPAFRKQINQVSRLGLMNSTTEELATDSAGDTPRRIGGVFAEDARAEKIQSLVDKYEKKLIAAGVKKKQARKASRVFGIATYRLGEITGLPVDTFDQVDFARRRLSEWKAQTGVETYGQQSASFKNWFGESVTVDEKGNPLVLYHATDSEFSVFDLNRLGENTYSNAAQPEYGATARLGVWLNTDVIGDYTKSTKKLYAKITNPIRFDNNETLVSYISGFTEMAEKDEYGEPNAESLGRIVRNDLIEKGYDGIVVNADSEFGGTSYVVFKNDQIKSVENSGAFDPNNPDIYAQFAGNSALTADSRALSQALNMERNGEAATKIREQTGWFRGADRRWRFEIADNLDGINFDVLNARDNQIGLLGEIYQNNALYEAYPFLVDGINVVAVQGIPTDGYYDNNRTIYINTDRTDAKKTLIHEIAHVLQVREGFARGGSASSFAQLESGDRVAAINARQAIIDVLGGADEYSRFVELQELMRTQPTAMRTLEMRNTFEDKAFTAASRLYADMEAVLAIPDNETAFQAYQRLAGETEARDVENRAGLSERRRAVRTPDLGTDPLVVFDGRPFPRQMAEMERVNAAIELTPGLYDSIVSLFETANATSPYHEWAHHLFNVLAALRQVEGLDGDFASELDALLTEMGAPIDLYMNDQNARLAAQEKFATTFEDYISSGKAPTAALQKVFEQIRNWFIDVYKDIKQALGIEMSESTKEFLDNLLSTPEERESSQTVSQRAAEISAQEKRLKQILEQKRVIDATETNGEPRRLADVLRESPINTEDLAQTAGEQRLDVLPIGIDSPDSTLSTDAAAAKLGFDSSEAFIQALVNEQAAYESDIAIMQSSLDSMISSRAEVANWVRGNAKISYASVKNMMGAESARQLQLRLGPGYFAKNGQGLDTLAQELSANNIVQLDGEGLYNLLMLREDTARPADEYQAGLSEGLAQGLAEAESDYKAILREYRAAQKAARDAGKKSDKTTKRLKDRIAKLERDVERAVFGVRVLSAEERALSREQRAAEAENEKRQGQKDDLEIQYRLRAAEQALRGKDQISAIREQEKARRTALKERLTSKYAKLNEARKAKQARAAEIRNAVQQINRWSKSKTISFARHKEILALLEGLDLRNRYPETLAKRAEIMRMLDDPQFRAEKQANLDRIKGRLAMQISEEERTALKAELKAERAFTKSLQYVGTKSLGELSLDEIRELHTQIKDLYNTGREEYKLWATARDERRKILVKTAFDALSRSTAKIQGVKKGATAADKAYRGAAGFAEGMKDGINAYTLDRYRLLNEIDGKRKYKGFFVNLFGAQWDARDAERNKRAFDRKDNMDAELKKLGFKMKDFGKKIKGLKAGGVSWTLDEAMHVYVGMKNPRNRDALLYGTLKDLRSADFTAREKILNEVINALTDAQKQAAELVVQDFDANSDYIESRLIETTNNGYAREQWYVPLLRTSHAVDGAINIDSQSAMALDNAGAQDGVLGRLYEGFTKSRVDINPENQAPIVLGLFNTWISQMTAQEHTAAFTGWAQDVASLLYSKNPSHPGETLGAAITNAFGRPAWDALVSNANVMINNGLVEATDRIGRWASIIASRKAEAALAFNIGTSFKQIGSLPRFIAFSGVPELLNAVGRFVSGKQAFLDEAFALDPSLRARSGDAILSQIKGNVSPMMGPAFAMLGTADRWIASIGFMATYEANIKNGRSREDAIAEARRAVAMTQNATTAKDKALLWKSHAAIRTMMLFTGDSSKRFNISTYDMANGVNGVTDNPIKDRFMTAFGFAADAVLFFALSNGLPDADDDETLTSWLTECFSTDFIDNIPLLGPALLPLTAALGVKQRYNAKTSTIYFEPIDAWMKAAKKMKGAWSEEEVWYKALWSVVEAVALLPIDDLPGIKGTGIAKLTKIPTGAIKRTVNAAGMAAAGETYDAIVTFLLGQYRPDNRIL